MYANKQTKHFENAGAGKINVENEDQSSQMTVDGDDDDDGLMAMMMSMIIVMVKMMTVMMMVAMPLNVQTACRLGLLQISPSIFRTSPLFSTMIVTMMIK